MIKIRKAKMRDVERVVEMWKEFRKEHDRKRIEENPKLRKHIKKKKGAEKIFKKWITKNIKSKNSIVWIGEADGEIAGYSLNYIKENIPVFEIGKLGYFGDLFVRKKFRNKNISSKFKNKTIEWLEKRGIKNFAIRVHAGNKKAHKIYKKWGFIDYQMEMRKSVK